MAAVSFYDTTSDDRLRFAVVNAKYNGFWVFCKHKARRTYELPGGRREAGEDIVSTAKRELWEETGASDFTLKPVCIYAVTGRTRAVPEGGENLGMLFYADIRAFGKLPQSGEMERIVLFANPPDTPSYWTYPDIQPYLVREYQRRYTTGKRSPSDKGGASASKKPYRK